MRCHEQHFVILLGRVDSETTSSGPTLELNQEEGAIFVEHLKHMAVLGYWVYFYLGSEYGM